MKSIFRLILPLAAASGLAAAGFSSSCTRDLNTYAGEDGIYFDTKWNNAETLSDSIWVAWGTKNSAEREAIINLHVLLFGNIAPYDRHFEIKVETDIMPDGYEVPVLPDTVTTLPTVNAQEGIDFETLPMQYTLAAGKAEAIIPVKLIRREGLTEAKRAFKISLVENDELKFLYTRAAFEKDSAGNAVPRPMDLQRVIVQDENFSKPSWWLVFGDRYYGKWSQEKQILICDVMNINRAHWLEPLGVPEGRHKYYGRQMHLYLLENPHYEKDGKLMTMGVDSSY